MKIHARNEIVRRSKVSNSKPYAIKLVQQTKERALGKSDNWKSGSVYAQNEGVPPGKNFIHVGLKYLDINR
jgi:hypothetical protein